MKVQHTNKKDFPPLFQGNLCSYLIFSIKQPIKSRPKFYHTAQFHKNCKITAYQKQVQIPKQNTHMQAVFEITSQMKIS